MQFQSLVVREADASDARELMPLLRSLAVSRGMEDTVVTGSRELKRAMSGPEPKFGAYLAEVDGRPAGFVAYTVGYSILMGECYINVNDIFVKETLRGAGVGRQLMAAIGEECERQNCRARWEVGGADTDARKLYERMGVEIVEKGACVWRKAAIRQFLKHGETV